MENQSFELLEEKIDQILRKLNELKKENAGLKERNQELQSIISDKESKLQELTTVSESSQSMQTEIADYKEKQDNIRLKVEGLLDKLQEFEQMD
ncbi:hypothetical protein HQ585_13460 [candidate division KSB1 bacterium]|nr:hypothetical protein [candidate division KSB1 bacterium]